MDFTIPVDHRLKMIESEKKAKYLNLTREMKKKKTWSMKMTVIPNVISAFFTFRKGFVLEDLEIRRRVNHPDNIIIKICQNTEKSPGDLRRLAVTNSSEEPSANAGVKNSQMSKITMFRDYKSKEKKEEEDLPAFKIASINWYKTLGRHKEAQRKINGSDHK